MRTAAPIVMVSSLLVGGMPLATRAQDADRESGLESPSDVAPSTSSEPVVPTGTPADTETTVGRETGAAEETETALAAGHETTEAVPAPYTLFGYAETDYSFNLNQPSNGITHLRGFDNRHNTFTIQNVALGVSWDWENVVGNVTLQVGHTGATYYIAETSLVGALGTNATSASLWQFVQQANVGYRVQVGRGLLVQAGLFLSPIGPESMVVHDDWNWSRSNLFFGLPFYHTGLRLSYPLDERWTVTLAGYNGWNTVVDNNDEKSITAQITYTDPDRLAISVLYFTGVERPTGAPEGRAWRHLFDAHATWHATEWLSLLLHVNGGFEPNSFGTSGWFASALYARARILPELFLALRGDVFYESTARNGSGVAGTIFWPAHPTAAGQWVSSGTATVEVRAAEHVSFRFEYRHDHAASDIFFGGAVSTEATSGQFIANRASQDTLTAGATAWF
ncbi:MAG: porin [Deltaproteobacteria bacterium]|nr:porin [Deltaproteobacteria bacterium]